MSEAELHKRIGSWLVLGGLVGAFLVADFALPAIVRDYGRSPWVFGLSFGFCAGQLTLVATWAVLAPGNFMVRLPWSLMLLTWIWCALVIGARRANRLDFEDPLVLAGSLLTGFVAAQIPLWIARLRLGWRLTRARAIGEEHHRLQFGLAHMLLGMLFLSLSLGPARMVLPANEAVSFRSVEGELFVLVPVVAVVNALMTLPWIWFAFQRRKLLIGFVLLFPAYCAAVTAVQWLLLTAWLGPGGDDAFNAIFTMNLGGSVAIVLGLLPLRAIGFRLVRREKITETSDIAPKGPNNLAHGERGDALGERQHDSPSP